MSEREKTFCVVFICGSILILPRRVTQIFSFLFLRSNIMIKDPETVSLILEVKQYQAIWDKAYPDYWVPNSRTAAWLAVAEKRGLPGELHLEDSRFFIQLSLTSIVVTMQQ